MGDLKERLIIRFGKDAVKSIISPKDKLELFLVELKQKAVFVLITNGLSNYKMPVNEKLIGREFNELAFCLPSYWEIENFENERFNWVYTWLEKLSRYVVENNTWFGPGHTIPCGRPFRALSSTMKANHLLLSDPIFLEDELDPLEMEDKLIHFLTIIPIFEDEMDYKQGKGTFKLMTKLKNQGVTEKLDDFRATSLKSKWRLRRKI